MVTVIEWVYLGDRLNFVANEGEPAHRSGTPQRSSLLFARTSPFATDFVLFIEQAPLGPVDPLLQGFGHRRFDQDFFFRDFFHSGF